MIVLNILINTILEKQMNNNEPEIITEIQAKAQINHLGRSLILYLSVFLLLQYGTNLIETYAPQVFHGLNPDLFMLIASSIVMLLVAGIAFSVSASKLKLKIIDYLSKPKVTFGTMFQLVCIGIGIQLIITSISSLFYFFFHTASSTYAFVGNYTTMETIYLNIAYFVFYIILKPICDEYIFRGIIQRQLGHYGRYFGVLASSVLYAMAQSNLVEAIPALFIGWFLAIITLRYHSIRPAVIIHILVSLFIWGVDVIPESFIWVITVLIVIVYITAALSIFQKHVLSIRAKTGATDGTLWKILFTSSTIIIYTLLFILNLVLSSQI